MTHTPGPFHMPAMIVNGQAIPVYNNDGSHKIAHVFTGIDDARLFAAAPDLLTAIKSALASRWLSIDHDRNRTPEACDIRRQMIVAIDKAEGR